MGDFFSHKSGTGEESSALDGETLQSRLNLHFGVVYKVCTWKGFVLCVSHQDSWTR